MSAALVFVAKFAVGIAVGYAIGTFMGWPPPPNAGAAS
jgi:uncharacterized membrane protein YccC